MSNIMFNVNLVLIMSELLDLLEFRFAHVEDYWGRIKKPMIKLFGENQGNTQTFTHFSLLYLSIAQK